MCSGAWQDSGVVDAEGGKAEALVRRGVALGRSGVAQPAGRGVRGAKGFSSLRLLGTVIALRYFFNCPLKSVIDIQMEGFRER